MRTILLAINNLNDANRIASAISSNYSVDVTNTISNILEKSNEHNYDVIFIDLLLLDQLGEDDNHKTAFRKLKIIYPLCQIIVIGWSKDLRRLVKAVKCGANDYLTLPFIDEEVKLVLQSLDEAILQQTELDYLRDRFWQLDSLNVVKTASPVMKEVFNKIRSVAPTKVNVLLYGETGTGKGVMAQLIHRHSNRANEGFISVHCGAIPDTLLESELFGHERGAFTGATRKKLGKFEIASEGTIFLDEIGTITPAAQVKLLEVLQDGTFSRVGGETAIKTHARIIAATNADLKAMSDNGLFRRDLFYRLNVFPIDIPPLRLRTEDIPHLIDVFLNQLNHKYQRQIDEVHPLVMAAMQTYDWPGNVRELENLVERAYIIETVGMLMPQSFPPEILGESQHIEMPADIPFTPLTDARRLVVEAFEKKYLRQLLQRNKGKINKSAEEAGIGVRQLHKLMQKYHIRKEKFVEK